MAYENLDDLRRENARLKAEAQVDEDYAKRDDERAKIKKENLLLRHRKKIAVVKQIGSGFSTMFSGIRGIATDISRGSTSRGRSRKSSSKGSVRRVRRVKRSSYSGFKPSFSVPTFRF